jgi:hypothetical protein
VIVNADGGRLRLVTQSDHAATAAEILALWRADGLPDHPRRAELLRAAREHDNGWREADAAPRLEADGRPADFRRFPEAERRAVWRRGVARLAPAHPYAALLVAEHALVLHRERAGEPEWAEFAQELEEQQAELAATVGLPTLELAADYRFLHLADLVSLTACGAWESFQDHDLKGRRSGSTLLLDPFPLAGSTTFKVPCRHIPDRPYAGEADLAGELGPARWEELSFRLSAAP